MTAEFSLEAYLADLARLVSIDSKTGYEEGVNRVAALVQGWFTDLGWKTRTERLPQRGNCLIAANKTVDGLWDLLFSVHGDTVQPVGHAARYPLAVANGIAHGAGACDDKANVALVTWICRLLPREALEKLSIAVIVNPGEEASLPSTLDFLRTIGAKARYAMVYEPGRPGDDCVRARKGSTWVQLSFKGLAAHAGNNPHDGRNAVVAMARAILEVAALESEYDVTICPDVAAGGTVPNTVADTAHVICDIRYFDNALRDAVVERIRSMADRGFAPGVSTSVEILSFGDAMKTTEASLRLTAIIDEAARRLGQTHRWLEVGGASDGNTLSSAGAAVVCGMGVVGGDLHNVEKEWFEVSSVQPRLALGIESVRVLAEQA